MEQLPCIFDGQYIKLNIYSVYHLGLYVINHINTFSHGEGPSSNPRGPTKTILITSKLFHKRIVFKTLNFWA